MRVTATTRIACPAGHVFDTVADLRNEPQWNSRVSNAELRSDEARARVRAKVAFRRRDRRGGIEERERVRVG